MSLTKRADEMLGMELFIHGCHASTVDWLLTRRAQAAAFQVIVEFAVGHRVVLEEARRVERRAAFLTHEAARVPVGVQSRDEVVDNRALTALTLRG